MKHKVNLTEHHLKPNYFHIVLYKITPDTTSKSLQFFFLGALNYGVGTNFMKFSNLEDVAALAPCMGSIEVVTGCGEFLRLVGNLCGLFVVGDGAELSVRISMS